MIKIFSSYSIHQNLVFFYYIKCKGYIIKNKFLILIIAASSLFAEVHLSDCKVCHGVNFELKALGKSKIVKDMTKQDVSNALIGYKNGTYGSHMRGIMIGKVHRYNESELKSTGIGK